MPPRPDGQDAYQSKYWPVLNGLAEDSALFSTLWGQGAVVRTDRENALLDVIGAYDLLLQQGLTDEKAISRLGLRKNRDQLVQELDFETARRLRVQSGAPADSARLSSE